MVFFNLEGGNILKYRHRGLSLWFLNNLFLVTLPDGEEYEKEKCECNDGFFGNGLVDGCKSVADDCQTTCEEKYSENHECRVSQDGKYWKMYSQIFFRNFMSTKIGQLKEFMEQIG